MSVTPSTSTAAVPRGSAFDEAVFSKVSWRIMPLLVICYIIAFLDRINVGFAQAADEETLPASATRSTAWAPASSSSATSSSKCRAT